MRDYELLYIINPNFEQDRLNKVMENVSNNKYRPVVDSIFNFKDIKKAHERIENGINLGKVVLSI